MSLKYEPASVPFHPGAIAVIWQARAGRPPDAIARRGGQHAFLPCSPPHCTELLAGAGEGRCRASDTLWRVPHIRTNYVASTAHTNELGGEYRTHERIMWRVPHTRTNYVASTAHTTEFAARRIDRLFFRTRDDSSETQLHANSIPDTFALQGRVLSW